MINSQQGEPKGRSVFQAVGCGVSVKLHLSRLATVFAGPVVEQKQKTDRKTRNCVLCRASVLLTFCQSLSLSPKLTQGTWKAGALELVGKE